ncbi:MAG: PucR family transcriptional regulator [Tractidigestivibacter sp.]|jgi:hypothetical protein|uniref:PucR family transcriptional regulator n=1 Tax=Tractidigestivibacter sp. TaxID=2847320 RepID=UPI003D91C22B
MKIDMALLAKGLGKRVVCHHVVEDLSFDVAGVRLFSPSCPVLDAGLVYVVDSQDVSIFLKLGGRRFISTLPAPQVDCECILFEEGTSPAEMLSLTQGVFDSWNSWETEILDAAIGGSSITKILALCARPLKNPIALFDSSMVLVATAGEIPSSNLDEVWTQVLTVGYYSVENDTSADSRLLTTSTMPFIYDRDGIKKAQACLERRGEIVGYLGSTELLSPFSLGELSAMRAIQLILERTDAMRAFAPDLKGRSNSIIERMLSGQSIEPSIVRYVLRQFGWDWDDKYRVVFFCSSDPAEFSSKAIPPFITTVSRAIPHMRLFAFEDGVVGIHRNPYPSSADYAARLSKILLNEGMIAVLSTVFSPIDYLHYAYLQCRTVLALGETLPGAVLDFENSYTDCIVKSLDDSSSLTALCHPFVYELSREKNGEEKVRCLASYLSHGKNITDTARELGVHRNTVTYRIEQLDRRLGRKIGEADPEFTFHLLLSCIIVEHRSS